MDWEPEEGAVFHIPYTVFYLKVTACADVVKH